MAIEIRRPGQEHLAELGRICYDAFYDISTTHGFPPDFASVEFATGVVGLLMRLESVHTAAAFDGDRPRGSNFMNMLGDVAGIGPISVDLDAQGEGIGTLLMQDALRHAGQQGFEQVRLCQDSFNMRSLALYASLGFEVKEPLAYMTLSNAGPPDDNFRPAAPGDYDEMDALCREVYRISRKGEYATLSSAGFPAFVLDRGDRIRGYIIGTAIGHAVAETDDDMLALLAGIGAAMPDAHAHVAMRQGDLYRRALAAGHRNRKVMNLMAYGPYEEPAGTYCPSVMF
jgi:ribosomal protein S18 acetylase RimI-like enzyme